MGFYPINEKLLQRAGFTASIIAFPCTENAHMKTQIPGSMT
jgi:hypothetical protein